MFVTNTATNIPIRQCVARIIQRAVQPAAREDVHFHWHASDCLRFVVSWIGALGDAAAPEWNGDIATQWSDIETLFSAAETTTDRLVMAGYVASLQSRGLLPEGSALLHRFDH